MKGAALLTALVLAVLGATALPFLPGRPDALAVPVSLLARVLGLGSLLCVPVGLLWLPYEWTRRGEAVQRGRSVFVGAAAAAGTLAALAAGLLTLAASGATLAAGVLIALACAWRWGMPRWLAWARRPRGRSLGAGAVLVLLPLATAGSQWALAKPLAKLARERTMDALGPLIDDIESYREKRGQYPRSLLAEWGDYRPRVIGGGEYRYEPTESAFNLAVEVPSTTFDAREFLLYNPEDKYVMRSHDSDLLRRSPEELARCRGYHSAAPAGRAHWRLLTFD